jgi:hypothetical protein
MKLLIAESARFVVRFGYRAAVKTKQLILLSSLLLVKNSSWIASNLTTFERNLWYVRFTCWVLRHLISLEGQFNAV